MVEKQYLVHKWRSSRNWIEPKKKEKFEIRMTFFFHFFLDLSAISYCWFNTIAATAANFLFLFFGSIIKYTHTQTLSNLADWSKFHTGERSLHIFFSSLVFFIIIFFVIFFIITISHRYPFILKLFICWTIFFTFFY